MRVAGRRCSSWLASTPAIINRNPINLSGVDSDGSRSVFNPNPAYLNSMILNHIRGATQTVSKEKPLRQFVAGKGKSAGRNSKGRITIFHRGVRWEGEGKTKDVDPAEKYYVEDIFPPFVVTSYRTGMKGQFSFSSIPGMIESRKAVSNRPKTRHVVMGLSNGVSLYANAWADGLHCCFYTELGVPRMALAGSRPDFFVPRYKDAVRDSQSMAPNESVRQQDIGLNFVGVVGEKDPRMKAREKAREKQLLNGKFTADRATVTYILATNQVYDISKEKPMSNKELESKVEDMVEEVKTKMGELFGTYKERFDFLSSNSSMGEHMESEVTSPNNGDNDFLNDYYNVDATSSYETETELDRYLREPKIELRKGQSLDILQWWKVNGPRFPIVSKMARDILAIQISTVASEAAFSTGGRVLDPYRTRLSTTIVEALICTQDWVRKSRTQINWDDVEDLIKDDEIVKDMEEQLEKLTERDKAKQTGEI
ncbi:zinc finger BED domain-containing protein RICESLEEPER 2 [Tanacetum coccineum]